MKTIVVDDNALSLEIFEHQAKALGDIELAAMFQQGTDVLAYARRCKIELAVLDIELPGISGIELGRELKRLQPDIMLIYITGHEEYAMEAIRLKAAGYLVKPYTIADLAYAVKSAGLLFTGFKQKAFARTFGHFDLFEGGKPVLFHSAKAKELLALLVDRQGGTVTTEQSIAILWPERPFDEATQNLCCKTSKTLSDELERHGLGDLLLTARGVRSVNTAQLDCDLYDLLSGDPAARKLFLGDYMLNYSWSEARSASLSQKYLDP